MYDTSKENLVTVNGLQIATETFGDTKDPAILLIQGAGNSMISWDTTFCQRIADAGRFVIRYDSRDTGRSTNYEVGNPPYSFSELEADAVALIKLYSPDGAHVFGLSQGAGIAQLLAIDHPELVKTLTLMSGTPGGPGQPTEGLSSMSPEIAAIYSGQGPAEPDWNDRESVAHYLVEGERPFAGGGIFDEEWFLATSRNNFDRTQNLATQITNPFLISAGEQWRHKLKDIKAPTLVLHGTRDPLFPIDHGQALAKEIPGARFVPLENVGHAHVIQVIWDQVIDEVVRHTATKLTNQ